MTKALLFVAAASLALAACVTDPNPGERSTSRVGRGALAGGVGGALIGGGIGGNGAGAAVGGVLGAILGGATGGYMDKQERELRERTAGSGIGVVRQGDEIRLEIPSGVTFDFNSAALRPGFRARLDDVAQTLSRYRSTFVDIGGHTDSIGSDAVNQRLSEERAFTVADYLEQRGVAPERITPRGYGKTMPIASNETEAGRADNRRVEIRLVPITDETLKRRPPERRY